MLNDWLENEPETTLVCAVASAVSLVLSLTGLLSHDLPFDIAWVAIIACGVPILVGAFRGVIFDHDIKADLLVSLALIASVATREYFAAGEVALIMQIGSLLEDYTSGKARESIDRLVSMTPIRARVIRDGQEALVPVEEVCVGDELSVIAGETIPVDGVITSGETSIDESVMTGESVPVDKGPGDTVASGTVNQLGVFAMRATATSEDSSVQRMARLAREAEENKAPIVSAADRWATWLVLVALACAAAAWAFTGEFMRAVTVLVVFCPCAFILATPTAMLAGIGNAARRGIIVRSGDALERLSTIQRVAFDKTGTLTYGKPQVTSVVATGTSYTEDEVLRLAALAERQSEHPLGKAICARYDEVVGGSDRAEDFEVRTGRGIAATVDGRPVLVGKPGFMDTERVDLASAAGTITELSSQGATVVCVASEGDLVGLIALADTVRDDAADAVKGLIALGITPMLLTGDNEAVAMTVAGKLGIPEVRANLLPEEKMEVVRAGTAGSPTCMVGDGVNDALALAAADAGIAMGGIGSDIAVESADAILVSDEVRRLPYLLSLSRKVMAKIRTNIIASLAINLSAVVLSTLGILTPVTGALWHNFGSVFVVVNAALLLREHE